MLEVKPQLPDVDREALEVFLEAIEALGGPRGLVERRRLTWLPSLMEAAYAVVLAEHHHRAPDEIAAFLGISRNTLRNILSASPEGVKERLFGSEPTEEAHRTHIAGGLAKLAYERWLQRRERAGA